MLTVYKASAGSGKTYTLTYEYIKLLLGYKDRDTGQYKLKKDPQEEHQAILAITFTNKATEEMKSRIIKELAIIAELPVMGGEVSPYLKDLTNLFGCSKDELKECASRVLGQLLFDYTFFNVSTIDSFFQNVLRTFAFEADLTGDYNVELEDNVAISAGVGELFNAINYRDDDHSRKVLEWLRRYVWSQIEDGKSFNLFNRRSPLYSELVKFVNKLSDEQFKLRQGKEVEEYFSDSSRIEEFEKALNRQLAITNQTVKNIATEIVEMLLAEGRENVLTNALNAVIKWQDVSNVKTKDLAPSKTITDVVSGAKSVFKGKYSSPATEQAVKESIDNIISNLFPRVKYLRLLRKDIYSLGLIGDAIKYINEFREKNNIILLSDTTDLLKRIISEDDAPFIYERLGVRLKHFLIDEFQDTSRLQWTNISPLVSESLSTDNDNLIIGDVKQSIYRFRNSDPSLLQTQVPNDYAGRITERGVKIEENTNWRSSAEVVRFNNTLFMALGYILGVEDIYSNAAQQVSSKHKDHKGYVKFEFLDDVEASLEKMAADIKRQLASGYKQKDIAILVRNSKEGEKVISYLMELKSDPESGFSDIEIMTEGALDVATSPVVQLIINTLRLYASDVRDSLHKKSRHRYHQMCYQYLHNKNCGMSPGEALVSAIYNPDSTVDELLEDVMKNGCTNLISIVECIIETISKMNKNLIEESLVYVTAFQDEVLGFCARGNCDLNAFLRWWDSSNSHYLTSSTDVEAIRVMTIHKSKGLEFGCVHIPMANWLLGEDSHNKSYRWFDSTPIHGISDDIIPPVFVLKNESVMEETPLKDQYLENKKNEMIDALNVTYVAFTRAVDELCVNCCSSATAESLRSYLTTVFETASPSFCDSLSERYSSEVGELFVPLNNGTESILEIGQPTVAQIKEKKEVLPVDRVIEKNPEEYYTKYRSDIWEKARLDEEFFNDTQEQGVFLHKVLEQVQHRDDLMLALKRQGYRENISQEKFDEIYEKLSNAINDSRVEMWFEGFKRVLTERPIGNGDDCLTTRPDRVVWTSQGTVDVVDYKFGKADNDKYFKQVQGYMNALREMGEKNVRGFVWYVLDGDIQEVK